MAITHRRWRSAFVLVLSLLAVASAACGTAGTRVATPLPGAPEPAVSPPSTDRLPGNVLPLPGTPEGIVVGTSGRVAVSVRDPNGLVLFDLANPGERRLVPLTGSARHLFLGAPDGPVLVAQESDDRFVVVDLHSGETLESVPVGRQPHDAIGVGPATVFVADELADTIHVVRDGAVADIVAAPVQPGGLASSPDGSVAISVGVRGRRITAYRADGSVIGSANSGKGPTHAVTGDGGLFWVVDTDGGAVLGFEVDASGPHQVGRIGVGAKPYGVAYDHRRATLWVTLTGSNRLVGLHLKGTSVTSRTTYDTVRQPNTVAVDPSTGTLVVTGSMPEGSLQIIER